jgi:hypothetical protein
MDITRGQGRALVDNVKSAATTTTLKMVVTGLVACANEVKPNKSFISNWYWCTSAAVNTLNPAYQAMVSTYETNRALERGDAYGAGYHGTNAGIATLQTVGTAVGGAKTITSVAGAGAGVPPPSEPVLETTLAPPEAAPPAAASAGPKAAPAAAAAGPETAPPAAAAKPMPAASPAKGASGAPKINLRGPVARPYRTAKKSGPQGTQANHLNQDAAYGSVIPSKEGLTTPLRGDAIVEPGTPHYRFHAFLERFWDPYRRGGSLYGKRPTNGAYGSALERALVEGGESPEAAKTLADQAAAQRRFYGLKEGDPVPRVPGRINQAQGQQ